MESISERLKEERNRLNLTQDDLSNIAGVSRRTQTNYENGARMPDAAYLAAIGRHGVDINYIVTGERTVSTEALEGIQEAFYECVREVEAWLKENDKTLSDKQIVQVALNYYQAKEKGDIKDSKVALNLILKTAVNL